MFSGDPSLHLSSFINVSDSPVFPFSSIFSFSGSVFESDIDSWCVDSLFKESGLEVAGRDEFMSDTLMYSERVCLLGDPRDPAPV
jgi:hypothetical protein